MSSMRGWGKFYGRMEDRPSRDGHTIDVIVTGSWELMAGAKHMLCEDGVERNFFASTGVADSFWTMAGYVHAYGKRLKGFISYDDDLERWTFKTQAPFAEFLMDRHTDWVAIQALPSNVRHDIEEAATAVMDRDEDTAFRLLSRATRGLESTGVAKLESMETASRYINMVVKRRKYAKA